jgi:ADP-ribose pyrophosphatase YjhB (NUDIX family)
MTTQIATANDEQVKLARYGPDAKYGYGTPAAGFCISSFALVRPETGSKRSGHRPSSSLYGKQILLCRPREHNAWLGHWSMFRVYKDLFPAEYEQQFLRWLFPSTYLFEGEHPDDALKRVLVEQLTLKRFDVTYPGKLLVFSDPSDWYPGRKHWDFCFVYDVALKQNLPKVGPPWFSEMKFVDPVNEKLSHDSFGSEQGDLAEKLGLLSLGRKSKSGE